MDTKVCKTCSEEKSSIEFYKNKTAQNGGNICLLCKRVRDARFRARNPDKVKASMQRHYAVPENREKILVRGREQAQQQRLRALAHYGGCCACCGESEVLFLTIDHVFGGGSQHRKQGGQKICRFLVKHNFPEGFRVLCWNCNAAIGLYGQCPKHRQLTPGVPECPNS